MNITVLDLGLISIASLGPRASTKDESHVNFTDCLFVALRPKSTAMVIAGRSVHLTTLFPGQA